MGDVNDFSADPPDAAGSTPTSRVLKILEGTVDGADGGPVLRNVMERVPQSERITSWCALTAAYDLLWMMVQPPAQCRPCRGRPPPER